MTRIRIEGCAWHQKNEKPEMEQQESHQARFARCLRQPQTSADPLEDLTSRSVVRQSCYRILGGIADGVVFELNEDQGEIKIRLLVSKLPLYHLWARMAASWSSRLQRLGLSVSLEVIHVVTSS